MIEKGSTKEAAWVKYCSSRIKRLNTVKSCVDRRGGMTLLGRWLGEGSRDFALVVHEDGLGQVLYKDERKTGYC